MLRVHAFRLMGLISRFGVWGGIVSKVVAVGGGVSSMLIT